MKAVIKTIASGFGTGYSPVAPGSVGSLVGIPLFLMVSGFAWPLQMTAMIALTALAIYTAGVAERLDRNGRKDPGWIVIDEIAGMLVTLLAVPPTFLHILAGYLLFRLFDILKVFPANICETGLHGGYAIVLDDVVAGIYAHLSLRLLIHITGI